MTTTYMKLPYEDRVLRPDALRPLRLSSGIVGFTLDVRLNYYRGMPLSACTDTGVVLDFLARAEHRRLVALGTSCPDHFLRTKVRPMVLDLPRTHRSKTSWPG